MVDIRAGDPGRVTGAGVFMKPKLIIFDCDGVLVDSELISAEVCVETLGEAGMAIRLEEVYERFLGRSLVSMSSILADALGKTIGDDALKTMRERLYDRFRQELKAIPHVANTLDALDIPFCVASSSQPERIRLSLELAGLKQRFEPNIFSATMVANGKPAPDLFLHAARALNVEPGDCVVIEDSPAGVAAAQAAGMTAFAFVGGGHAEGARLRATLAPLAPAAIFDDMRELASLLHRLSGRPQGNGTLIDMRGHS
jgi:HAD superfamily hydrolase (TIGR01509 family)